MLLVRHLTPRLRLLSFTNQLGRASLPVVGEWVEWLLVSLGRLSHHRPLVALLGASSTALASRSGSQGLEYFDWAVFLHDLGW